jgi:hypothetical protein
VGEPQGREQAESGVNPGLEHSAKACTPEEGWESVSRARVSLLAPMVRVRGKRGEEGGMLYALLLRVAWEVGEESQASMAPGQLGRRAAIGRMSGRGNGGVDDNPDDAQEKIWAGVIEINTFFGALHPDEETPVIAEPSANLSGLTGKKL